MAGNKYLGIVAGVKKLIEAIQSSAGAGDAGKLVSLDATGKLDVSMMPVGVGADVKILPASEALTAGNLINIWDDAGTTKVRKADATAFGKKADGFVIASVSMGSNATCFFEGINDQLSGLTGGTVMYLSETAGALTATPPTTTGSIIQAIGKALSSTELSVEIDTDPVEL